MSETMSIGAMLADQVDRLFASRVTHASLGSAETGRFPGDLWDELDGMGIGDALAPEAVGGAGLGWAELDPLFRSLGHHAAPVPLGETIIGRWALAGAGLAVPPGVLAVVGETLGLDAANRLDGRVPLVAWAPCADHGVAVAETGGGRVVCLVSLTDIGPSDGLGARATIARVPAASVDFTGRTPLGVAPAPAPLGGLGLLPVLAVLRAAQMAGGMDRALELAIDHANTRVQFGRPIGRFQAVQHMIAELAELTAAASVGARIGCGALDAGDVETGPAIAKCRAGQSVTRGVAIAHQVFGAMGVTDEHVLHFVTRRLLQWRDEGGNEHWWAERLGRAAIAAGGARLWSGLTG